MALVTFDGLNKLIIANSGTTSLSVKVDVYSDWKEWVVSGSANRKWLQAMRSVGGDPLPGGQVLGSTFFLMNGWKIRPQEANHTLTVDGNLYSEDGSSPYVPPTGTWAVAILGKVSTLVETVMVSGSSDGVWNYQSTGSYPPGSTGKIITDTLKISKILLTK